MLEGRPLGYLFGAALIAGALWSAFRYRRRRSALLELGKGIDALASGRPTRPVQAKVGGALGRLVAKFGEAAPAMEVRIARLEQDRQQLRAVLSGMAGGVIAVDSRRRLLFANTVADRLFALGGDSVGRLVPELIRIPAVQEAVEATLTGRGPFRGEFSVLGRDPLSAGLIRVLSVQGTPLPGSPPIGAVFVFDDVTELRRLERLRQDFVANASHELKTPLASIKAYTETLLEGALHDEEVNVRFLRQIDEQADRLNELILDLLSLARLESEQEFFEHGPLPAASSVRRVVEAHRDRAEVKGLEFVLELGDVDDSAMIRVDEEALRQVLDNLIDNAIKYTAAGGKVGVAGRVDPPWLVLEVSDSGVGIPRDELPRVFERFYRVDKARSRELGGTGLGLSIVKHLVQSVGGQISVASRLGVGTTFTLRLPHSSGHEP